MCFFMASELWRHRQYDPYRSQEPPPAPPQKKKWSTVQQEAKLSLSITVLSTNDVEKNFQENVFVSANIS